MVIFDTNILVYATFAAPDAKTNRARDLTLLIGHALGGLPGSA